MVCNTRCSVCSAFYTNIRILQHMISGIPLSGGSTEGAVVGEPMTFWVLVRCRYMLKKNCHRRIDTPG